MACIFCDGSGKKSKEHIWPKWMHDYLPLHGARENIVEAHTFKWKTHIDSKRRKRQGHLSTKKIRVVCRCCNSGWMGQLETEVRPVLLPILKSEIHEISLENQAKLSRWIALKAIVGEFQERETHVTPLACRRRLMVEGVIPDYYCIYIGAHNEAHDAAWLRISQTFALSKSGPSPSLGNRKRNCQSIAMTFGPLFVYLLAVRQDGINSADFIRFTNIQRLFPEQGNTISWPPKKILNSKDMGLMAYALDDMKELDNISYVGELPETEST